MKTPKFRRLTAEALEKAGQLRIPGIDTLRALIQPIVALVGAVKAALGLKKAAPAPVVTETERCITVRLQGALLTLSGDEREFYDAESIQAAIAGCGSETDVMDTLEGMGFSCRRLGMKSVVEIDAELLEGSDEEFAFA